MNQDQRFLILRRYCYFEDMIKQRYVIVKFHVRRLCRFRKWSRHRIWRPECRLLAVGGHSVCRGRYLLLCEKRTD